MENNENDVVTKILQASCEGKTKEVERLLDSTKGDLISQSSPTGARHYPLHEAALNGQLAVMRLLLERGASVGVKTKTGATPLHLAAKNAELRAVQLLLDNNAEVDAKTESLATPLHFAAEGNSLEVARELLERGAQIDATMSQGRTPFHQAAKHNAVATCELLVDFGANINATTETGSSALHIAAGVGGEETIRFLISRGVEVDQLEGSGATTALHVGATNGHASAVQALLENGANPDILTDNGMNALLIACQWGHSSVVRTLLQKGADIEYSDPNGWSCLHTAAYYGNEGIVMQLLDFGATPSKRDNRGLFPGESFIAGVSQRKSSRIQSMLEDVRNREATGFWRRKMVQQRVTSCEEICNLEMQLEQVQGILSAREREAQSLINEKEALELKIGEVELQTKQELERSRAEVGKIILESQSRVEEMREENQRNMTKIEVVLKKHVDEKILALKKNQELEATLKIIQAENSIFKEEAAAEKRKLERQEEEGRKKLEQAQQEHQQTQEEYQKQIAEMDDRINQMRLELEKKDNAMIAWTEKLQTRLDAVGTEKAKLENEYGCLEGKLRDLVQETSNMRISHNEDITRLKEEKCAKEQQLNAEKTELLIKLQSAEKEYRSKIQEMQDNHTKAEDDLQSQVQTLRNINLHARRQEKEKKAEEEREKLVTEAQKAARESLHRAAEAEENLRTAKEEIERLKTSLKTFETTAAATLEAEKKNWEDEMSRTNSWAKELEAAIELTNSVHERKIAELLQQIDVLKSNQEAKHNSVNTEKESSEGMAQKDLIDAVKVEGAIPASVNLQLLQVTKENEELLARLQLLERERTELDHKLQVGESEVTALVKSLQVEGQEKEALAEKLQTEKDHVTELHHEISSLKEKIVEFEAYSEKMTALHEGLEAAIAQKVNTVTNAFKSKLETAEKEVADLEKENISMRKQLLEVRSISQHVPGLETQLNHAKEKEEAYTEEIQELEDRVQSLESVAELATKGLEEAEKNNDLKEKEIVCLKDKIKALEVDVASGFTQRLRELEGKKAVEEELQQEIESLKEKLSLLQQDNGDEKNLLLKIGSAFSSNKMKEMADTISSLEREKETLQARVNQLEYFEKLDNNKHIADSDSDSDSDDAPYQASQLTTIPEEDDEEEDASSEEEMDPYLAGPSVLQHAELVEQKSKTSCPKLRQKLFTLPSETKVSPGHWRPISALTFEEVSKLLQSLQLDQFVKQFRKAEVTGELLLNVQEEYLENLGMRMFLRRAFLQLLDEHRTSGIPCALIEPKGVSGKQNEEDCSVM